MFRVLFVLFIAIPIIEIAVLIQVGELFGLWPTIAIVIASAWLGAKYVRQQGIATMQAVQTKMAQGQMPSTEIVTGLLLLVAGVLLVTPGFVTDIFGLSLLIPSVRATFTALVQKKMIINQGNVGASYHQDSPHQSEAGNIYEHDAQEGFSQDEPQSVSLNKGETLEGNFERKD
jgi:UPF0716 protein FxsA